MLANLRLKEARVLLDAHCWDGAYYLAGYAVECALKACIARQTERRDFPDRARVNDSYTHDLSKLAALAGLDGPLRQAVAANPELSDNWRTVKEWWELSRYERTSQVQAETLVNAVGSREHGFLRWLRRHW